MPNNNWASVTSEIPACSCSPADTIWSMSVMRTRPLRSHIRCATVMAATPWSGKTGVSGLISEIRGREIPPIAYPMLTHCGGRDRYSAANSLKLLADPARFELTTSAFGGQRSSTARKICNILLPKFVVCPGFRVATLLISTEPDLQQARTRRPGNAHCNNCKKGAAIIDRVIDPGAHATISATIQNKAAIAAGPTPQLSDATGTGAVAHNSSCRVRSRMAPRR